jgi:hypothetical protein
MADQGLSQESRLFRVIGDKARSTEQTEPINSTESPVNYTRRQPFGGQPQCISQGSPQEGSDKPILEVMRSHGWGLIAETAT